MVEKKNLHDQSDKRRFDLCVFKQKLACVIILSKGKRVAHNNHDSLQPFYDQQRAKIIVGGNVLDCNKTTCSET
jgi:hypothetical protein